MRMPRSCAIAAALIRLTASESAKMPAMAALRIEIGLALGDASAVGHLDIFEIAVGGVREEMAEARSSISM